MKIKIKRTKNIGRLIKIAEESDAETEGLDRVVNGWVVMVNGEDAGVSGIVEFDHDKCMLDPLAIKKDFRNQGLEEILIRKALEGARNRGIKRVYTATKYIQAFKNCGFTEIPAEEIPSYVNICLRCEKRGKTCFPLTMRLDLR